jgi:topoisomerase IA-like protein
MSGLPARSFETWGISQKVPEHELLKRLDLHQALQILIDRRRSAGEKGKAYDRITIEKTYMVETPASMAAAKVSSATKAWLQHCNIMPPPLTHGTHATVPR